MIIAVTRLRLRSIRFLLPFAYHARLSRLQAARTRGCLDVHVRKTRGLAFWTLTQWDSEDSLRRFLREGAHKRVMPRLADWCDEAAVTHWEHEGAEPPTWEAAAGRLAEHGRLSRVHHPSALHEAGKINLA